MYEVSDAFKAAMRQPVQRQRLRGRLRFGARTVTFEEKNIIKNSFTLSNQCSGSDNVEIGTVYTAELNAVFCGLDLTRYTLQDGVITPELQLMTSEGWEPVPLGVFTISEANWTTYGVEVTAYDNMSKFDKTATISASNGTLYDYLALASKACGVELGMTRAEVQLLPNGSEILSVYEENDIETWRDLIAWVAQTTGTFATIDREGKLMLKAYTIDPVDTISDELRLSGAKFSDFTTRYTGLSCVNIADQVTVYYGLTVDDGLTYNLGQNPLLQYGLETTLETQRRAILNAISVIAYVPMEVSMIGSPAYDLGDVIKFEGGISGESLGCITKFDWTFGGEYQITGVGENPALSSARSKVDKNIAGLLSQTSQDVMHYYDYINAVAYHIGDGASADIIAFKYVTTKQTHIDFHAEIKYTLSTTEVVDEEALTISDGDALLKVSYNLNGDDITDYYPIETRTDGEHLLHLLYVWSATANVIGTFTVKLEVVGGDVTVDVGDCRAYIAGQGIVGDDAWDGGVTVEQDIPYTVVSDILLGAFTAAVGVGFGYAADYAPGDSIPYIDVRSVLLGSFTGTLGGIARTHWFDPVHADDLMEKDNVVVSGSSWVVDDSASHGYLTTPTVSVDKVYKVTSNHSGGDVAYIVSFDGGTTWWTYSDGWMEPDYTLDVYGMFEGTMSSITREAWALKVSGSLTVRAILLEDAVVSDICIYEEDFKA